MSFLCRIGWHDWHFAESFRFTTQYTWKGYPAGENSNLVQDKTCRRCGRELRVKVGE